MHPALSVIAQIGRTDAASLRPEHTLNSLKINKSLGLGLLRSALERRFQRKLPVITWKTTIQELLDATDGAGEARPALPVAHGVTGEGQHPGFAARLAKEPRAEGFELGHGVDIQEISALPETADKWEEYPFYAGHFSADEMAAARGKPDVRAHLAGIWSAKEAVKKSDPELAALEFSDIAISQDPNGRPEVQIAHQRLRDRFAVIVSISHSSLYAIASAITRRR